MICHGPPSDGASAGCYICDFRIFPRFQKKGYGKNALEKLETEVLKEGIKWIVLDVGIDYLSAGSLNETMGYETPHYRMKKHL